MGQIHASLKMVGHIDETQQRFTGKKLTESRFETFLKDMKINAPDPNDTQRPF